MYIIRPIYGPNWRVSRQLRSIGPVHHEQEEEDAAFAQNEDDSSGGIEEELMTEVKWQYDLANLRGFPGDQMILRPETISDWYFKTYLKGQ